MPEMLLLLLLVLASALHSPSIADEYLDVRLHLSSVSRYGAVKDVVDKSFIPTKIPEGCKPIHLNLVARHGTRSPTEKRMKELKELGCSLQNLIANAKKNNVSPEKIPSWLDGWRSPWEGKTKGGELLRKGEEEHYELAFRIKERFAELFSDEYHPDVYSIIATQVPRASASAVAFGMGLFKNNGTLGREGYRAFAVSTENLASDTLLRFHDTCENYKEYKKSQKPAVEKEEKKIFDEIADSLCRRHGLNFTGQNISSLWFLCKQEASLLDITYQACDLFTPDEVALLEWTDDMKMFVLKGYGKPVNYNMGVRLLDDVYKSMERAIEANKVTLKEAQPSRSYEKARLRFAHAETLIPFSCLLGLFLEASDFERVQRKQPLDLPPKPPQKRNWKGSIIAPFAGNNMLVLYSCPVNTSSQYFVHALHNEQSIPIPGCDNSDFCPFEVFKEKIVMPQLKNDYDSVCKGNLAKPKTESEPSKTYYNFISELLHLDKLRRRGHLLLKGTDISEVLAEETEFDLEGFRARRGRSRRAAEVPVREVEVYTMDDVSMSLMRLAGRKMAVLEATNSQLKAQLEAKDKELAEKDRVLYRAREVSRQHLVSSSDALLKVTKLEQELKNQQESYQQLADKNREALKALETSEKTIFDLRFVLEQERVACRADKVIMECTETRLKKENEELGKRVKAVEAEISGLSADFDAELKDIMTTSFHEVASLMTWFLPITSEKQVATVISSFMKKKDGLEATPAHVNAPISAPEVVPA